MSSDDPEIVIEAAKFLVCPNCQGINPPGSVVCSACGVNLCRFHTAQERLRERLEEETADHLLRLSEESEETVATHAAHGRVQTKQLLKGLLVASIVLAVAVASVAAFYGHQRRLRRERLARDYEAAMVCLSNDDYLCARDGFAALLRAEPGYRDAQAQLNEARYHLARQLGQEGAWTTALTEIDELLKDSPDDTRALALRDEIYNLWLKDAREKRDWLTVIHILAQQSLNQP